MKKVEQKSQHLVIAVPTEEMAVAVRAALAFWRGHTQTFIQVPSASSPSWQLYADDVTEDQAKVLTHIAGGVYFMMHEYQPVSA